MPFDSQVAAALDGFLASAHPLRSLSDVPAIRAGRSNAGVLVPENLQRGGRFSIEERTITVGPDDVEIQLLLCSPTFVSGPTAVVYFIHGGGMVAGDFRADFDWLLDWAEELGIGIVSVDYRLAPEVKDTQPARDCYAGMRWVIRHASELSFDPTRFFTLGVSAGGGLAAASALIARELGELHIAGQMLLYPMLDDRNNSISAFQMDGVGNWDRQSNEVGWSALLGDRAGANDVSSYVAPGRETDLSGLPPTYIEVGSAETFREEDIDFARRIWEGGGSAELHVWSGGTHGFDSIAPDASVSKQARVTRLDWFKRQLG